MFDQERTVKKRIALLATIIFISSIAAVCGTCRIPARLENYAEELHSHSYIRDAARWWWLRSPGRRQNSDASVVRNSGDVWEGGQGVDTASHTIRPAIWISNDNDGE